MDQDSLPGAINVPATAATVAASDGASGSPPQSDCDWILGRFPLLSESGLRSKLEVRFSELPEECDYAKLDFGQAWAVYQELRTALVDAARGQMDELALLAVRPDCEGELARKAVAQLLLDDLPEQIDELRPYCQQRCALAILELAPIVLPRTLFSCLTLCLTRKLDLQESARIDLLEAFKIASCRSNPISSPAGVKGQLSRIVMESLELELVRPRHEQSSNFFALLFQLSARYTSASTAPMLHAVSKWHHLPAVREMASSTLRTIEESLQSRWEDAAQDLLSNLDGRTNRLATLNKGSVDPDVCVQTIFNNMKGCPVESVGDPRVLELWQLMLHMDVSVRAAACWSVAAQGKYQQDIDEAIGTVDALADIAVNAESPGLRRDAVELMTYLEQEFPASQKKIALAKEAASQAFVRRLTLDFTPDDNGDAKKVTHG